VASNLKKNGAPTCTCLSQKCTSASPDSRNHLKLFFVGRGAPPTPHPLQIGKKLWTSRFKSGVLPGEQLENTEHETAPVRFRQVRLQVPIPEIVWGTCGTGAIHPRPLQIIRKASELKCLARTAAWREDENDPEHQPDLSVSNRCKCQSGFQKLRGVLFFEGGSAPCPTPAKLE